jgi:hypothetical protein
MTIANKTTQDVRVAVLAPNGKGVRAYSLKPDGLKLVATRIGGAYLIRVLADRTYINQLTDVRIRLLAYANTPNLPVSEYQKILKDIETLRRGIKEAEDQASKDSPTCSGVMVDYSTLDATIYTQGGKAALGCAYETYDFSLPSGGE